ncbi:hypothetical protein R83H12_00843 [Fibrobacteria bacterium R8-3-H12]
MEPNKKKVYIETTIPSLVTAKPSADIGNLFRQTRAKIFWEYERHKYDLYTSQYVIEECEKGDKYAAERRLELLKGIPHIPKSKETDELAEEYFKYLNIPQKAKTDSSHLAICVVNKINVLLSWNMTHLGDIAFNKVVEYNARRNLWIPSLLDPDTFMRRMKLEETING